MPSFRRKINELYSYDDASNLTHNFLYENLAKVRSKAKMLNTITNNQIN